MPAIITVVYPRPAKPDATFKFDYDHYFNVHMPLVQETWGPKGLRSFTITEHKDPDEPYFLQCSMSWDSLEDFGKASTSEDSAKVFADVPNFTDIKLKILKGDVVRKWQML
ncbi:unnamed protein product [Discula destructiva]